MTDVGSWSFVTSNEPVKNGCEVIYETFHISLQYVLIDTYFYGSLLYGGPYLHNNKHFSEHNTVLLKHNKAIVETQHTIIGAQHNLSLIHI